MDDIEEDLKNMIWKAVEKVYIDNKRVYKDLTLEEFRDSYEKAVEFISNLALEGLQDIEDSIERARR